MSANNQISSAFGKLLEAIDGKLDQAYWFVVWDSKLTKNSKQQYRHYTNSLSSHRQNLLMLSSLVSLQAAREWQKDGISFLPCSTSRRSLYTFLGGGIGSSFLPPLLPALVEGERLFLLSSLLLWRGLLWRDLLDIAGLELNETG